MEHFPGTLTRRESDELVERVEGGFKVNPSAPTSSIASVARADFAFSDAYAP
jgi:hypothetical protein